MNGSRVAVAEARIDGPSLPVACLGFAATTTLFTLLLIALGSVS